MQGHMCYLSRYPLDKIMSIAKIHVAEMTLFVVRMAAKDWYE